jgi:hypothetical protein
MEPVPYEIQEDDVDEVLAVYEPVGGGSWPEEERVKARRHVMSHVVELNEVIATAAEDEGSSEGGVAARAGQLGEDPGDRSPERRDTALAAIEDLLIRDGFIDLQAGESRAFPATGDRDTERDDA